MIEYKIKEEIGGGYTSTAYALDDEYILLVGKNETSYETYKDMKANADLLDGVITTVDYPHKMRLIDKNSKYPYGALLYPMVKGTSLNVEVLSEKELGNIAMQLLSFNKQLHSSKIHWDRERAIGHEVEKINRNIAILQNYIEPREIMLLKRYSVVFEIYLKSKESFCITHGDLWADNLLLDKNNNLRGVIDFGNMAYFLPEVDYASMWNMADGFVDKLIQNSDEDITRESVNLFILHRELCSFEFILETEPEDIPEQLEKMRQALTLVLPQLVPSNDSRKEL